MTINSLIMRKMLKLSLLTRLAYFYLLIPIVMFGLGWLNFFTAILFCFIVIIGLMSLLKAQDPSNAIFIGKWDGILGMSILLLWVAFSGIGGFFFQNWDHHSRNAVFRDLIDFAWPVVYHLDSIVAAKFGAKPDLILSYYFGFWLPAALIGKLAGWSAANLALFIWGFIGLLLSIVLTAVRIKLSFWKTALFLIFFSGMDIVGVWLLRNIPGYTYPGIWPPLQHLEWWAGSLQYASFTTWLFWTYNQFIPTLLILSLFVNLRDSKGAIFLAGICFFFAPLPALGLLPFVLGKVIIDITSRWRSETRASSTSLRKSILNYDNVAGLSIAAFSLIFYSTNLSAQSKGFGLTAPFALYLLFLLLEGMMIWLLLLPDHAKDWSWYIVGFILAIAPVIRLGASWDFMMRTTFPSLYLLFIGCGIFWANQKTLNLRASFLLTVLILGAFTPIYEVNRSLIRTDQYYGSHLFPPSVAQTYFESPPMTNQIFVPEFDHLDTLIADEWISVSRPNSVGWDTKVGNLFSPALTPLWNNELIQK